MRKVACNAGLGGAGSISTHFLSAQMHDEQQRSYNCPDATIDSRSNTLKPSDVVKYSPLDEKHRTTGREQKRTKEIIEKKQNGYNDASAGEHRIDAVQNGPSVLFGASVCLPIVTCHVRDEAADDQQWSEYQEERCV
jgi:hypothetical protein